MVCVSAEYLQVGNRSIRHVAIRSNVKRFKKSGPVCNKVLQRHIPERRPWETEMTFSDEFNNSTQEKEEESTKKYQKIRTMK